MQTLLEEEYHRASKIEDNRWISVRARLHQVLLKTPGLLEAFRNRVEPKAQAALDEALYKEIYTHYLYTPQGLEAALRIAEQHHQSANFAAASRILTELEQHPDLNGNHLTNAAKLATRIATFAGKPHPANATHDQTLQEQALDRRDRWRARASLPTIAENNTQAPPTPPVITNTFEAVSSVPDLQNILQRPVVSTPLSFLPEQARIALLRDPRAARRATRDRPRASDAQLPLVWYTAPTLAGNTVLLNDGITISAFERQTLQRKWRVSIESTRGALSPGSTPGLDDLSTVIAQEGVAYALSGISLRKEVQDERVVIAIDIDSGAVKWRTTISTLGDETLFDAVLRGKPVLHQGVLVLTAIKQLSDQRLVSVYLVGLDANTGQRLWTTTAGSVGAARWSWDVAAIDHATPAAGIIYRADTVGAIAAVEAATGQLLWARAHPLPATTRTRSSATPGENHAPVIIGDTLYTISPDRQSIYAINRESGELIKEQPASAYGSPRYILNANGTLIYIRDSGIVTQPAEDFATTNNRLRLGTPPRMRGRVIVAGDTIITPTDTGIATIPLNQAIAVPVNENGLPQFDAQTTGDNSLPFSFYPLQSPGITLIADNQLIVADDTHLHAYARWEDAKAYLDNQLANQPDNISSAVAFVQLAAQAGAIDSILPAIDRAAQALDAQALNNEDPLQRRALFTVVLALADPDVTLLNTYGTPQQVPISSSTQRSPQLTAELINRLARIASTEEQRAAHAIAAARFATTSNSSEQAINFAAQLLRTPDISDEQLAINNQPTRASAAATAILTERVLSQGPAALASINIEARFDAQRLLSQDASPIALINAANSYPLAPESIKLRSEAADKFITQSRPAHAANALATAVQQAVTIRSLGISITPDTPTPDELRAKLAAHLYESTRYIEASATLADMESPAQKITINSTRITRDQLRERIASARSTPDATLPTIKANITVTSSIPATVLAEPLAGRHPLAPQSISPALTTDFQAPVQESDGEQDAQWALSLIAPTQSGTYGKRWTAATNHRPVYITSNAIIAWTPDSNNSSRAPDAQDAVRLQSLSLNDGSTRWTTPILKDLLPEITLPGAQRNFAEVDTVLRSVIPVRDITYAADQDTLIIARRDAALLAIDANTGNPRWSTQTIPHVLHDFDAKNNFIAIIGSKFPQGTTLNDSVEPERRQQFLQIIDTTDGSTLASTILPFPAAWVRITEEAAVVVGSDQSITAFNPFNANPIWQMNQERVTTTSAAVTMPGLLLVRMRSNRLALINTLNGIPLQTSLSDAGTLDPGFGVITTRWLGSSFAISTRRGTAVYDTSGELIGLNVIPTRGDTLPAAFTTNAFFTAARQRDPDNNPSVTLARYLLPSGEAAEAYELELVTPALSIISLPNTLLLSSENETIVIQSDSNESETTKQSQPTPQ